MLITHDLGVVAEMAERVVVMYAGRKVEEAPVDEHLRRAAASLYAGLLGAVPKLGSSLDEGERAALAEIPGLVPSLRSSASSAAPSPAAARWRRDLCRAVAPAIEEKAPGHLAACHYARRRGCAA